MLSKVSSLVNLQNRFDSLMVTEEISIENESQVQTSTNYHQRIESKSKSVRRTVSISENYNNVKGENLVVTAPGNRSFFRTTKYGRKNV